jgi:DNA-binding transcriptional ArsR family regulator
MSTATDDQLWSAIADPSRRLVLDLLVGGEGTTASSLAQNVPFSRQAVTKHLVVLEQAGLINRQKEGREVRFRVDPERLNDAAQAMAGLASQWDQRLQAIKRLAEAAYKESNDHESH